MKKQNLLVLGVVAILIAAVAVIAAIVPRTLFISENAPSVVVSHSPASEDSAPVETVLPQAEAYLVMSVRGNFYEPLPLTGEGSFVIKQDEATSNTVHITPASIWMEHSTCENQDCVDQGTVSLENMDSRVLSNMIICLPNEVVLELHTPETLKGVLGLEQ